MVTYIDYLRIEAALNPGMALISPNKCWVFEIDDVNGELLIRTAGGNDKFSHMRVYGKKLMHHESGWTASVMLHHGGLLACREEKEHYGSVAWEIARSKLPVPLFLMLNDDATLGIWEGVSPKTKGKRCDVAMGEACPAGEFAIKDFIYDFNKHVLSELEPLSLHYQTVENKTNETQSSTISGSVSYSISENWSHSESFSFNEKASIKVSVPFIKVETTMEVSFGQTTQDVKGNSRTETHTYGYSVPVTVPPHTRYRVDVMATKYKYTMPFTVHGTYPTPNLPAHDWKIKFEGGVFNGEGAVNHQVRFSKMAAGSDTVVSSETVDLEVLYLRNEGDIPEATSTDRLIVDRSRIVFEKK